eukprot:1418493-Lingulodinium_polyedra.AAC.1
MDWQTHSACAQPMGRTASTGKTLSRGPTTCPCTSWRSISQAKTGSKPKRSMSSGALRIA